MIEKEFIPYQEALALKELGFNEECFWWYDFEKYLRKDRIGTSTNYSYFLENNSCSAPTYSQVFRWFRDKYNLFHSITEYNKDGSLIIEISKDRVKIFNKMTNFDFTEYREAELACLKKLIQTVKEQ